MECDPDAQERADLIEKCLAHGLSDEEIEGVLREHMFAKMVEQEERERSHGGYKAAAPEEAPPAECKFEPRKPPSVAAKRQAKAASLKSVSFGPSDEEIAGILEDHARQTPSPQAQGKPVDEARAAYLQSKQQALAAKNRNRNGSTIF
jgi:hypothetical protein